MDWRMVLFIIAVIGLIVLAFSVNRYTTERDLKRRQRRREGSGLLEGCPSGIGGGSGSVTRYGGGSSGGAGTTRSFAAAGPQPIGGTEAGIIAADSMVNGGFPGDGAAELVGGTGEFAGTLVSPVDAVVNIAGSDGIAGGAANVVSGAMDMAEPLASATEFMGDAAEGLVEIVGEVVTDSAGEIVGAVVEGAVTVITEVLGGS